MRERELAACCGRGNGPPLCLDLPGEPHLEGTAEYPGATHESAKGTVRPLRLDPNLARVRCAPRLSRRTCRLSSTDMGSLTTNTDCSNTHPIPRNPRMQSGCGSQIRD